MSEKPYREMTKEERLAARLAPIIKHKEQNDALADQWDMGHNAIVENEQFNRIDDEDDFYP